MLETGILKECTPYHHIFLDGKVPLVSVFPCRPSENKPLSFMVNSGFLTALQKELLARLLQQANPDKTHDDCLKAVRNGIAIDVKWFAGVFRSEQKPQPKEQNLWELAGQIDAWLSSTTITGLVALLNISYREQTNLSHQVKEWGFDDISQHVIEMVDDLSGEEYLELAYYLSATLIEHLVIEREAA
ncbi:hypothetical protein A0J48_006935 [Sphaerospermopsis aphanizomenoides BCCUSP55]|uniref:hypothetical protein n=1 Tax=Sphaerospermopsis aphanizomenoides TaxID=459663 RepID=UPI0019090360|nr:hypothetical protein [Sphaerospermopsis aphanizomenoides]MBK1987271.1 hypothetical protein [Sphaerospermopsis aphanizomenoides BCCUSP55]